MIKHLCYKLSRLLTLYFLLILPVQKVAAQYASIEKSLLLGGLQVDQGYDLKIVDGFTYIAGEVSSADMPVTNGSRHRGLKDIYVAKFNSAGTLVFASYYGGSGTEDGNDATGEFMQVVGSDVYILGTTTSSDLLVTNGSTRNGGQDLFGVKINTLTGVIEMSTYLGGTGNENLPKFKVTDGNIYLTTVATDFPVTNGSISSGADDLAIAKVNGSTGETIWATLMGGDGSEGGGDVAVDDNHIYIGGYTNSSNASFPSTDGTVGLENGKFNVFYLKLDAHTGQKQFLSYLTSFEFLVGNTELLEENGTVYLMTTGNDFSNTSTTDGTTGKGLNDIVVAKFDASNNLVYKTIIGGELDDFTEANTLQVKSGYLYFVGRTRSFFYPTTIDGFGRISSYDVVLTKLSPSGQIVFSTYMGTNYPSDRGVDIKVGCNDDIYLLANIYRHGYLITNGDTEEFVFGGIALSRFDGITNKLVYSSYLGGPISSNVAASMDILEDGIVRITGFGDYDLTPVTSIGGKSSQDILFMQVNTCPTGYTGSPALSPSHQAVCINGVVAPIMGGKFVIPSDAQPTLYVAGAATTQDEIPASYQWQVANAAGGPWTDVAGATQQNYTPPPGSTTKYYRRLAQSYCCGTTTLLQTSDIAEVVVNSNVSPVANAGGILNTCVGTPVTLGNATIATEGLAPYTVEWDNALGSVNQPSVSPSVPTVYTLKVTDANGCSDYDQAIVNAYKADAGPDVGNCAGAGVRIGRAPIAGVPGVIYAWTASPADPSLSCTDCAQPTVYPTVATTYKLTLTVPVTGGGTCVTTDEVTVSPVAAPMTSNFAGSDRVICLGSTATLGLAAEPGFTYTWAPGNYLVANNSSTTTFQPGSLAMPTSNVGRYYLTASKGGCSFVDEVEVAVIEARAGIDGCGPRFVGEPDRTPNINETYTWSKISGPGNFSGPTNLPMVPVTASVGGTTTYLLTVTYTLNGEIATYTDEVIVPDCGCGVRIDVEAPYSCPSYALNGATVKLKATATTVSSTDADIFTYTWSPAAGLSSTTGRTVTLTDNVERTYTVTMTSPLDRDLQCSETITVNRPAWSLPVFEAQDGTICPGASVALGQATVEGYAYLWTGSSLSDNSSSNPIATPSSSMSYSVLVTDIESGCTFSDIAHVTLAVPSANAGPDLLVCNNAEVTLGAPAQPNTTYSWSPSAGITYLNGTSSTSAQPQFLVATTSTYTVTATNTLIGCSSTDEITITVGTPVAPFTLPDIEFCPGSPVTLNPDGIPAGMTNYSWSPAGPLASSISATTTVNTPPSGGATYTLTVTNASGCSYSAQQKIVPNVTPPLVASSQVICYSSDPALNSSIEIGGTGVPGATYSWSPTAGLDDPTSPNPTYTPTGAGYVTFTVTKVEGGCSSTATVTITASRTTVPLMSSPTVCQNSSVPIGTPNVSGVTYLWSPTTGLSDPNISNPIASVGTSTVEYTLTAIGLTGCVAKAKVLVGVNPVPAPVVSVPVVTACSNDASATFMANVTPAGSYDYLWTPNNGTLSSIYAVSPNVNVTEIGSKTYQLTVTDPATGCSSVADAKLTVTLCAPTLVSIGSTAFIDLDDDGIQSGADETGIAGLLVKLYQADGTTLAASTITDASGNYLFSNLPEGSYVVGVTPHSVYTTASTRTPGTDDHVDSDNNGTQTVVGGESKSSVIVLTAGQEPTGETGQGGDLDDVNDANGDMTIDFGFFNPNALPVDLINFRAIPGANSVDLSWRTANEKAFSHFELQRSTDAREFISLARINGENTSFYSYRDTKPMEGLNYYRLKMVDTDGSTRLSRIITVNYRADDKYLVVENPANRLSFTAMTNMVNPTMQLLTTSGVALPVKVVRNASGDYIVSAPSATSGLYILSVSGQGGTMTTKIIIP
jgi:hypothetical protein